jgi:hypothetical protein
LDKVDLKKQFKHLYHPSTKDVVAVDVPPFTYLMIDGEGDPNTSPQYAHAVQALFSVSYAAKFRVKKSTQGVDYAVMPLEGLWWADDPAVFISGDRTHWKWTMMILQPSFVGADVIGAAVEQARSKGVVAVEQLRLERFTEGRCAQILHVGPFTEEGPTIERVHQFIEATGSLAGKHHEIYLSDIRRADPRKWRTVIRQPMQ